MVNPGKRPVSRVAAAPRRLAVHGEPIAPAGRSAAAPRAPAWISPGDAV